MSSASVDERIVKLMFDNKLFEQNAQTSIGTLEKLKQALKLDDASKSLDALEKKMSKQTSLESIGKSIDTLKDRFSAGGIIGMRVLQNLTDSAMNLGKKLIDAVNVPLEQIKQGGWTRAMNLEQAKFQIEALGASWNDLHTDMEYAVNGTAYGLDEAAKVAAQLTASGIKSGEEMQAALRGISGVAAMTGSSYADIGNIMATVAGNGRLYAQQLNQFAYRGLNATAVLAEKFGTTEAEIREMVKAGEIDFRTFSKAMDDAFGESATKANELFSGALSNVKAALSRIGADVASNSLTQFRDVLNVTREAINKFHVALGGPDKGLLGDINNFVTAISQGLIKFIEDSRFDKAMEQFANGLQNGFGIITNVMSKFREVFGVKFFNSHTDANDIFLSLMTSFNKFTESLKNNKSLATDAYHIFGGILTIIKQVGKFIGEVAGGVSKFFSTFQGLKVLNNLIKSFKNLLMGVKSVLEPIGKAFMNVFGDTNWKWVTIASRNLKNFTKQLRLSEEGAAKVEAVFTKVFKAIKKLGDVAGTVAGGALNTLATVWEKLAPNGIKISEGTKEIEKRYGALETLVKKTTKVFKDGDKDTQSYYVKGIIAKLAANPIARPILLAVDNAILAFRKLQSNFPTQKFEEFGQKVSSVFETAKTTVGGWVDTAIEKFKSMDIHLENPITTLKKLGKGIGTVIDKVVSFGKKLKPFETFKGILDKIGEVGGTVFEILGNGFDKVKDFVTDTLGGGLTALVKGLGDAFSSLGDKISGFVNKLDVSKIAAIGYVAVITAITIGVYNLLNGLADMSSGIGSFFKKAGGLLDSLRPIKESKTTLEGAAIAIAIVAASLIALSNVPFDKLVHGLAGFAAVLVGTGGFLFALQQMATVMKSKDIGKEFSQLARSMPLLAASVYVISKALVTLNEVDVNLGLLARMAALTAVIIEMGALVAAIEGMQYLSGGDGSSLMKSAVAVGLFALSIYSISKTLVKLSEIPFEKALNALKNSVPVFAMVGILGVAISKLTFGSGIGFALGVLGLQALVMVLESLGKKNWSAMQANIESFGAIVLKFAGVVGLIGLAIAGLNKLLKINISGAAKDFGLGMLGMAGAVYLIAVACEKIGNMDQAKLKQGEKTVGTLIVIFGLFGVLSRLGNSADYKGMALSFVGVAIAINSLVGAIYLIGSMDKSTVQKGTIAVGALIVFMGVFAKLSQVGINKAIDAKTIVSLAGTIIVLGLAMMMLASLSWDDIARGLTAMGGALVEFLFAFSVLKTFVSGESVSVKDIAMVIVVTGAALGVAYALSKLAEYDWQSLAAAAGSMSLCLLAIAKSFDMLNQSTEGRSAGNIAASVIELAAGVAAVYGLAMAIEPLATKPWDSLIAAAVGMGLLLVAIGGSFALLNATNEFATVGSVAASVIELAAGVAAVYGLTRAVEPLLDKDWKSMTAAFGGLSLLLVSISKAFAVFGAISLLSGGNPAVMAVAILGLVGTMAAITVFIGAVGWVCDKVNGAEAALQKGLQVLGDIGEGIGKAIGRFITGIMVGMAEGATALVTLGATLSAFMVSIDPFLNGITKINDSAVQSAKMLGETILAFAAASVLDAISRILTFGNGGLANFGSAIEPLGEGIATFSKSIEGMSEEDVKKAKIAAKAALALGELANAVPKEGGWVQKIIGENGFATFAKTLAEENVGASIAQFAEDVSKINESDVQKGANAGKMIADFASNISNTGGVLAQLMGDNTLSDFVAQLTAKSDGMTIGQAIAQFATDVGQIDETSIEKGANAGKMITDFASSIGNEGGFIAQVFGDNTIANLTEGLMSTSGGARIGQAISTFVSDVGSVDDSSVIAATSAGEAIVSFVTSVSKADFGHFNVRSMTNFVKAVQDSGVGKAIASFVGELGTIPDNAPTIAENAGQVVLNFVKQVGLANISESKLTQIASGLTSSSGGYTIGQAIKKFENELSGISESSVTKATTAATMVTSFLNGLKTVGAKSIPNFGTQLVTLGDKVKQFADKMNEINDTGISNVADKIVSTIKTLSTTTVSSAVEAMNTKASSFTKVGNTIVTKIKEGMMAKQGELNTAAGTLVSNAASSIKSQSNYNAFVQAGNYLASGFASGISSGSGASAAATAGAALAKKALDAIKKEADIQSPSKEAEKLGKYTGEGYQNGLKYYEVKIGQTAQGLGQTALGKLSDTAKPLTDKFTTMMNSYLGASTMNINEMIPALGGLSTAMNGVSASTDKASQSTDKMTDSQKKAKEAVQDQTNYFGSLKGAVSALYDMLNGEGKTTSEQAQQNLSTATDKVAGLGEKILATKQASSDAAQSMATDTENTKSHLAEVTEAYNEYYNSLSQAISGQINLFDAKDKTEAISSDQMIKNMASQVHAVMGWEDNIKKLSKSAIDQGLLMELAKLGPEGASKVESFVGMTDKQLARVNHLYRMRLKIEDGTANEIMASLASMGKGISDSVANGIDTHAVDTKMGELGNNAVAAVKVTAGVGAEEGGVSSQTKPVGQALVQGVNAGIDEDAPTVTEKINTFTDGMTVTIATAIEKFSETKTVHILQGFIDGINEDQRTMYEKLDSTFKEVNVKVDGFAKKFKPAGEASIQGYATGMLTKKNAAVQAANTVCQAVYNTIDSFIKKYAGILGYNMTLGFAKGMIGADAIEQVKIAAQMVVAAAINAIYDAAQEGSPSRLSAINGMWLTEGFGVGMEDPMALARVSKAADAVVGAAVTAFDNVGDIGEKIADSFTSTEALQEMENIIDRIAHSINEHVDGAPIIVPELDLSHIARDAQSIGSMFNAVTIGTNSSGYEEDKDNVPTGNVRGGTTFIQNNYSPKALSRLDIYRDTSNLFAMAKDRVNA